MRISTNTIFEAGVSRMNDMQSNLLKTQQQVATGRRILTPADDPVGSAQALNLSQGQAMNTQFATNRMHAKNALSQEEGALQTVTNLIQDLKSAIVQAGNPTMDDGQRKFIATDLRSQFDELMSLANSRDGLGNFIFGGYQIGAEPFVKTPTGAYYGGDQGRPRIQVDSSRQMEVGDSGDAIFMNIPSRGTSATASSNPALSVSPVAIVDARAPGFTGNNYDIVFAVSGGITSYSVFDTTVDPTRAGAPLATGTYSADPQTIAFGGMQMTVGGAPANGDAVTVRPAPQSSLFSTLSDVINLLEQPGAGALGGANLAHGLSVVNGNIDRALDHILATRASVGSRLKEIDVLDSSGLDKDVQYAAALSDIQDLDYNKALSDLVKSQMILEASQKSFAKITGLSLFDLL